MHNLIYLSSASHLFSDEELIDILTISRLNNTRLDITGLLIYHEGSILQILEGEQKPLIALFNTISMDQRHKGVIKMIDFPIEKRSFSDWSMGFKRISDEDWSQLTGHLDLDNKNELTRISTSASGHILTMIKSFENVNMNRFNRADNFVSKYQ